PTALRRRIAVVLQDVFLFSGAVEDNITLGRADISRAAVEAAAAHVNADGFIRRLGGYEAPVRERGSNLSGGQRQLLAFARALAHEPTILVLDEATSSVDAETEWLIQDALVKLLEGRTALVIAHRLSTIENADRILVLHKGELREQGTHRELLARDGIYARLYRMQYAAERPAPARAGWAEARLLLRRQPIAGLLARPDLPPGLRERLELVLAVRAFAAGPLGLRAGDSYTTFAEVPRDATVYVVSAARRDRLEAYDW